jgi:hypothetical protein
MVEAASRMDPNGSGGVRHIDFLGFTEQEELTIEVFVRNAIGREQAEPLAAPFHVDCEYVL